MATGPYGDAWTANRELIAPRSCDHVIFADQGTDASVSSDAVLLKIDRFG